MARAVDGHLPQPIVAQSKLLSLPAETRIQIYKDVFRGLEVLLRRPSYAAPLACLTLVRICQVCHTFLVEAKPVFLRAVTVGTIADVALQTKFLRLTNEDCRSIRRFVIFVTKEYSTNYSCLAAFLPNLEQLIVDLTPWRPKFLNIESAMKSKDTVVITDYDAEYDENKRIGVNRLFATFEEWVMDLAIERASADSKDKFKLIVRLDFVNEPIDAPTTVVVGGAVQQPTLLS
jgi:hypothetical protein